MNFIASVLTSSFISSLVLGILAFLFRSWISERLKNSIKHEYDQKLETHKAELKASNNVYLEKLKSELLVSAKEYEIKYSNMHRRQAEVIAEVYSKLVQLHWDLDEYVKIYVEYGEKSLDEKSGIAVESHRDFIGFFLKSQMYLSKKAVQQIKEIDDKCKLVFLRFRNEVHQTPKSIDNTQVRLELENAVKKLIPAALIELEDEFRAMVGNNG